MRHEDFYHFGMIVADFDAALDHFTREMGVRWSPVIDVDLRVWTRDRGLLDIRPRAVYSVAAPHLEIVAAIPDTPMDVRPGHPIHHLGYWTRDLHGDVAAMETRGWSRILNADDNGRMFGMAYLQSPEGQIVELVDRSSFPDWNGFLAGRMQHEVIVG
jgi:hypothetical protein